MFWFSIANPIRVVNLGKNTIKGEYLVYLDGLVNYGIKRVCRKRMTLLVIKVHSW